MPQQRVRDAQLKGLAGAEASGESPEGNRTFINADPQAKQKERITVDTASDDTEYKVTINTVDVTFTSDSSATKTEIRDGLKSAINSEHLINPKVTATDGSGSDELDVESTYPGVSFTLSEGDPNLSTSTLTANAEAKEVPFGRMLEHHGTLGDQTARLVDASNFTAREIRAELDGNTDGDYRLVLEIDGDTNVTEYSASGDSTDDILDNLASNFSANLVTANSNTSATPSRLELTAETAGFDDFQVIEADGPSQIDVTTHAEGDNVEDRAAGVAVFDSTTPVSGAEGEAYLANEEMVVKQDGKIYVPVEKKPTLGDDVYVRLSANGNLDRFGAFRPDFNSGCVPLDNAKWVDEKGSDVAVIKVDY